MPDPFADVKRRHPDIPQDPLPIEVTGQGRNAEPIKSQPSVRMAKCPECHKEKLTGVILDAHGQQVFRNHNKVLTSGRRIRCSGSGQEAPK